MSRFEMDISRRQRFVVSILALVAGFAILSSIAMVWMAASERRSTLVAGAQRLSELGSQFARTVSANDFDAILTQADASSPAYARLRKQFDAFRADVPDLTELYAVRYGETGSQVIVDTGRRLGEHRSTLVVRYGMLDPLEGVMTPAVIASMTGRLQVDDETTQEFGLDLHRVYVPVVNEQGRPVAVVVLSQTERPLSTYMSAIVRRTAPGWAVALLFVLTASGVVANAIADATRRETVAAPGVSSKLIRCLVIDAALLCLGVVAFLGLRTAYLSQKDLVFELASAAARHDVMTQEFQRRGSSREVEPLDWLTSYSALGDELEVRRSKVEIGEAKIVAGIACFGLITISALFALRRTMRAHATLRLAREDAEWHRSQHERIIDGLPIGFYAAENGRIVFSNPSMDVMLGRREDETAHEAFERALNDEDAEEVVQTLARAEQSGLAFDHTFRLGHDLSMQRYLETHGVPIADERSEAVRVVGFAMDVTDRVRAQKMADRRRAESERANEALRHALELGELNFEATVHALVKAVEAKDVYTAGHSERVMQYSVRLGKALDLSEAQLRVLRMGTLIHDVGKIGIPDAVLGKPDRLSREEFALIKQHPEIGVRMIEGIPAFADCVPIVLYHHERLDGRGYPYGLSGETIPYLARIAAVADCYDAMTSDRAYRKGRSPMQALAELAADAERGSLDAKIVAVFADIVLNDAVAEERRAA